MEVRAGFERWAVFERARAANRMRHAEAGEALAAVLDAWNGKAPRILDLGCGDARDMARVLAGRAVAAYTGVDDNPEVLAQADRNLGSAGCPVRLVQGDYAKALQAPDASLDLVWAGLFLHHLDEPRKRALFEALAGLLAPGGLFVAHDPVRMPGETKPEFIRRLLDDCRDHWTELAPEEKEILYRHWDGGHGHAVEIAHLEGLAREAGFAGPDLLWADPDQFYAVMAFRRGGGS